MHQVRLAELLDGNMLYKWTSHPDFALHGSDADTYLVLSLVPFSCAWLPYNLQHARAHRDVAPAPCLWSCICPSCRCCVDDSLDLPHSILAWIYVSNFGRIDVVDAEAENR